MEVSTSQISKVADSIKSATKILITAGAGFFLFYFLKHFFLKGMGVDSGMPDFRGKDVYFFIFLKFSHFSMFF